MNRDLLIPTSGSIQRLAGICASIASQTLLPERLIFLHHGSPSQEEIRSMQGVVSISFSGIDLDIVFLHHENSDYIPGKGIGYDRNFLLDHASSEYLFMIDDDNQFGATFFADCVSEYLAASEQETVLYSPLIERRTSGDIQSAGITNFRRWMPALQYASPGGNQTIKMIGANSLLGPTRYVQQIGFDSRYLSCLEDIDFTYRVWISGAKILVSDSIRIQHMEREKTFLEKKFLGSPASAYERSKNRILFAKKNATLWQKNQYFGCGLRAHTFWFLILSLVYGGKERWSLVGGIIKGTRDGILGN